jgi:hypothetical protein
MFKGEATLSCTYTLTFTYSLPSINEREIVGQAFSPSGRLFRAGGPPAFSMGGNQEWLPYKIFSSINAVKLKCRCK